MLPQHTSPCYLQRHLLLLDKSIHLFPAIPPTPDPFSTACKPTQMLIQGPLLVNTIWCAPFLWKAIYCSAPFLRKFFLTSSSECFLHKPKNLLQRRPSASEPYCSLTPSGPTARRKCSQARVTLGRGCTAHWQFTSHKSASLPKSYSSLQEYHHGIFPPVTPT